MILYASHHAFWSMFLRLAHDQTWHSPFYTQSALNYYRQRPMDEGKDVDDRSFMLMRNDEPIACFLGAIVEGKGRKSLLAYEVPCVLVGSHANLSSNERRLIEKEFDAITHAVDGEIRYRDFMLEGKISMLSQYLLTHGARAKPTFSRVIDLKDDTSLLKSNIRKSYRSLINWGMRELQPIVAGADRLTWEMMDAFRQLHIHEAGRETRSVSSWKRQFEMVKADDAFVVFGHLNDALVSAGFFDCSKTNCYYGISASRRDLFDKPLFHSLLWTAVLHAKKIGCRWFEVGDQVFPEHPTEPFPTAKEQNISGFKSGFGGETRMFLDLRLDRSNP